MEDDGFECYAWDIDWLKPEDESVEFPRFEINIQARLTPAPNEEEEDEEESFFIVTDSLVIQKTEQVNVLQLLDDDNNNDIVRDMLVSMGFPVQDFMVDRILACAKYMATNKLYMNRKVLRMKVKIEAIVEELPVDEDDEADDDQGSSSSSETAAMVEKLTKKVMVERSNSCCPICMDDFLVGMEAISMPCSHLVHHDCILPWLSKKKQCPLCRSELSNDAVNEARKKKMEGKEVEKEGERRVIQ